MIGCRRFNPHLQSLARKVAAAIRQQEGEHGTFNGVHLRIEEDATDWINVLGGRHKYWDLYQIEVGHRRRLLLSADCCRQHSYPAHSPTVPAACPTTAPQAIKAGFSTQVPVYVAAGVLSYNDTALMQEATRKMAPFAKAVVYKEMYLSPQELQGLHPEQLALLDFLVLAECKAFVGAGFSSFSVFIREYRALHGLAPRDTSFLVSGAAVGSDPLFARAAVFRY